MIRILIADDHKIVADGMASILSNEPDIQVLGQAKNGKELIGLLEEVECDLVVLDLNMPEMNGDEVAKEMQQRFSNVKVLVMSMHDNGLLIEKMLNSEYRAMCLRTSLR